MKKVSSLLSIGIVLVIQGCSRELLHRTGYEILQNIREQQCQKELSSPCSERESYDDYQRNRTELLAPERGKN